MILFELDANLAKKSGTSLLLCLATCSVYVQVSYPPVGGGFFSISQGLLFEWPPERGGLSIISSTPVGGVPAVKHILGCHHVRLHIAFPCSCDMSIQSMPAASASRVCAASCVCLCCHGSLLPSTTSSSTTKLATWTWTVVFLSGGSSG